MAVTTQSIIGTRPTNGKVRSYGAGEALATVVSERREIARRPHGV
jgi:hypothetical protein